MRRTNLITETAGLLARICPAEHWGAVDGSLFAVRSADGVVVVRPATPRHPPSVIERQQHDRLRAAGYRVLVARSTAEVALLPMRPALSAGRPSALGVGRRQALTRALRSVEPAQWRRAA
jgi:hypothetical protein